MAQNANRYALDLVVIDEMGAMYLGDAFHKTNYYVYEHQSKRCGRHRSSIANSVPNINAKVSIFAIP